MSPLEQAVAAHQAGDLVTAERLYREIIAQGEDIDALGNLGLILGDRNAFAEAETFLRHAVALAPGRHATHRINLANLYRRTARLADAAALYEEALRYRPNLDTVRADLGAAYLALGRDQDGWALLEHRKPRLNQIARAVLRFPEWRGEPLAGKRLLLIGEQGFGDQIFGARFIAGLGADEVVFSCARSLIRTFSQLPGVSCVERGGPINVAGLDYWAMNLSLPRWSPPQPAPYLAAEPARRGGVGVMWRGNAMPDPGRSLPEAVAARLLALPGAISLQPEDTGAADFQETAEIVAGLAWVVSIDTSLAHLAGALGRPGFVLLQHYERDWRWRAGEPGRSDWYPSLGLLRQPAPGDWDSVIDQLAAKLGA